MILSYYMGYEFSVMFRVEVNGRQPAVIYTDCKMNSSQVTRWDHTQHQRYFRAN